MNPPPSVLPCRSDHSTRRTWMQTFYLNLSSTLPPFSFHHTTFFIVVIPNSPFMWLKSAVCAIQFHSLYVSSAQFMRFKSTVSAIQLHSLCDLILPLMRFNDPIYAIQLRFMRFNGIIYATWFHRLCFHRFSMLRFVVFPGLSWGFHTSSTPFIPCFRATARLPTKTQLIPCVGMRSFRQSQCYRIVGDDGNRFRRKAGTRLPSLCPIMTYFVIGQTLLSYDNAPYLTIWHGQNHWSL
jgi:hypothetical protein